MAKSLMQRTPILSNKKDIVSCQNCSLNKFCLPRGLTKDEMKILEDAIDKSKKFKKKSYLYTANSQQAAIYVIKSGSVKTYLSNASGNKQILGFHMPGDLLGFDAFFTGKHSCFAQALDDTLVCELSMENFDKLCHILPSIRTEMMHQVGKEIQHDHLIMLTLGQMQTEERLATFLFNLSKRNQSRKFSKDDFQLSMTRQDLANYLGMAVETLSRTLAHLQKKNLISVQQRSIKILDQAQLCKLAHGSCKH
jgi:CRP/FNR family transcriptional regulator